MLRHAILCLIAAVSLAGAALAQPALPPLGREGSVAFLGVVFLDTSTEGAYFGERADEASRIAQLEDLVRQRFVNEGFRLMELDPIRKELDRTVNPAACYGCEVRMAGKLGASYVLVGEVQKVSNLILSMNLVMRQVPGGEMVRGLSVDIRSNTDESWARGMRYILKNHFFKE